MEKAFKGWWSPARHETRAEHVGIHGNPKKGATTMHRRTDGVNGDTYHPYIFPTYYHQ